MFLFVLFRNWKRSSVKSPISHQKHKKQRTKKHKPMSSKKNTRGTRKGNAFTTSASTSNNNNNNNIYDHIDNNYIDNTSSTDHHTTKTSSTKTSSTTAKSQKNNHNEYNNNNDNDDDENQVINLTQLVQQTAQNLKKDKQFFDDAMGKLGTSRDNRSLRKDIKSHVSNTSQWIKSTQSTLKSIHTPKNAQLKLQFDKLRRELEESLSGAASMVTLVVDKEKRIILQQKDEVQEMNKKKKNRSNIDGVENDGGESERMREAQEKQERVRLLEDQKKRQELILLENEIAHNEKVISEREDDILEIEEDIRDIHQTFREMNLLVKHQQVGFDLIENNVDRTVIHISEGVNNLEKANTYDKKNRNLICIIMLIILILAVVLAVVLVVVLKFTLHF